MIPTSFLHALIFKPLFLFATLLFFPCDKDTTTCVKSRRDNAPQSFPSTSPRTLSLHFFVRLQELGLSSSEKLERRPALRLQGEDEQGDI